MRIRGALFFLSIVLFAIGSMPSSEAQERIALVIGNSSYAHAPALPNPKNDAVAISDALEKVGFDVRVHLDLDQRGMQAALRDFGLKAETAEVALVYFAGHGIQVASQNYILPVDAQLRRERDLIYEATPLSIVTAEVAQAKQLGMVILDSCRDNPLAENLRQSLGPVRSKLIGLGMARVEDVPPDTLVAFSTRFNQLAYDGGGDLSPFTMALVEHIQEPGLELDLFFRKVRDTVLDLTANRQEPRTTDALGAKPFYFTAPKSNQPPKLGALPPLVVADDADAVEAEIGAPTDVDNDELSIEVMGLPSFGTVENAGEALNFGDRLSVADLEALTYRPSKGQIGEAGAFLFVARDGQGGVTAGRVPITVVRSNENPLVAAASRIAWPEIPLGIEAPSDPDGDPLTVTVLSVPTIGEVRNGGAALGVGDSLSVEALTGLTFDPSAGAAGEFAYEVADDHGGVSTSSITISLPGPAGIATVAATTGPSEPDQPEAAGTPATAVPPQVAAAEARPTPSFNPQMRNTTPEDQLEDEAPASASDGALLETLTASNIRNAPGTSAGWIAEVPAGTPLKLIRKIEDRNWYQIEMPDGRDGFISGSLTRLLEKEEPLEVAAVSEQPLAPQTPPEPPQQREEVEVAAVDPTALPPTEDFVECATCPVMVALPGGQFRMGSADGDPSEQPVREVEIAAPVAIGKYEVTVAQWQACASAGFCPKISDPEPDADHRPVQNISWADAESFVAWLRAETEQPYRLPTEAEWEYAARGGQPTRFWWGDSFEAGRANCAECDSSWDRKHPADIGAYQPNPFGLYGMNGGVSEWVADCWIGDYQDAPDNGAARSLDFCPQRVLRGGSWRSDIEDVTSSSRFRYDAQVRYYTNGFRVARDL